MKRIGTTRKTEVDFREIINRTPGDVILGVIALPDGQKAVLLDLKSFDEPEALGALAADLLVHGAAAYAQRQGVDETAMLTALLDAFDAVLNADAAEGVDTDPAPEDLADLDATVSKLLGDDDAPNDVEDA